MPTAPFKDDTGLLPLGWLPTKLNPAYISHVLSEISAHRTHPSVNGNLGQVTSAMAAGRSGSHQNMLLGPLSPKTGAMISELLLTDLYSLPRDYLSVFNCI